MQTIDADAVHAALDYSALVEKLRLAFRDGAEVPVRHHHTMEQDTQSDATLLLMPAWRKGGHVVVKLLTVFPDNGTRGLPAIHGQVMLINGETGVAMAMIDGGALTVRRTACASALAASYLAREDASELLMVGAGALAPHLIRAHAAVRPIKRVTVWNRNEDHADRIVDGLKDTGLEARRVSDLASALPSADIVSCATLSLTPLVQGDLLKPGAHVDLVGAFRPDMRESDDATVQRCSLFVDTRAGALQEGGDLVQPLKAGVITEKDIQAELSELTQGSHPGRRNADEITLFKSVGTAIEDLAAAELVADQMPEISTS
jgi:alanine dehydrogenase